MLSFDLNSFLGFNSQSSGIVQELLGRADLRLEDLLDEEAVAYEVKTQNTKLLDFLLDPENFKKIINYIITEPDLEEFDFDQKKYFKFPYVCADLLSCECNPIIDEFFKSRAELEEAERAEEQREKEIEKEYEEAEKTKERESGEDVVIEKGESASPQGESPMHSGPKTEVSNEITEEEVIKAKKDGEDLVYLSHLFTILDSKDVNLTCAGYFAKVLNNLFTKKPAEILNYIFKNNKEILDKLVQQIASKSIAELLGKFITFETSLLADPHEAVYNTERVRLLKLILQKLEPSGDPEEINNAAYLICEIFGKYNIMHDSQEILNKILERATIDTLFNLLCLKSSTASCAVALVLGNIFAYYILINTKVQEPPADDEVRVEEPTNHNYQNLQHTELPSDIPLIAAFLDNMKSIVDFINNTSSSEQFHTQFGVDIAPFGASRLKFLELLIISLKAGNKDIYSKLIEYDFFGILLKLVLRYEWNNMLHNQIEKILIFVIDGTNEELKEALLGKADLLNFIVSAYNEDEFPLKGKHERKIRRGYLGHLVKLANRLTESKDPLIEKHTKESARWAEFVETKLAEANVRENSHLGGKDPRIVEELGSPIVQLELPSIMQKFSKFFSSQPRPEQKNIEEEVIDGDDLTGHKEEDILEEGIPKDDIVLMEEEKARSEDKEKSNVEETIEEEIVVPVRGRSSFGFINDHKVGGEEEEEETKEESSNVEPEKVQQEEKKEEKAEDNIPAEEKTENIKKDDTIEEVSSTITNAAESQTSEDLLD